MIGLNVGVPSRVLTGGTDPEVEVPILWPPHEKRRLPRKDPDVGKDVEN